MKNLPVLEYYPISELCLKASKKIWYLIPYSILLKPIPKYRNVIEGLRGIYVYGRVLPSYLTEFTNYNAESYYRRFINNDVSNQIYRCPICHKPLVFWSVNRGYHSDGCGCNFTKYNWDNGVYKDYSNKAFNSVEGKAKSIKTQFISKGNPNDICAFYISFYKELNSYKYGVTNDFIESRERSYNHNQKYFHILLTATRVEVAEIEYQLKLKFNRRDEYFELEKFNEFKNYFKSIIESSNIRNTNQWKDFLYGG